MERDNIKHDWDKEDYAAYRRSVVRRSQRQRRVIASENGMCAICCIRKTEEGKKTCSECIEKIKKYNKERRNRMKESKNADV